MILIGISGKRGVGKDLLASKLAPYGFMRMSFAEELKYQVRQQFGLYVEHTDGELKEQPTAFIKNIYTTSAKHRGVEYWTPRQIMIAYGQFFRQFDPDWWVKKTFDRINDLPNDARVVIPDVRFTNEVDTIKAAGGMLVRLNRDPKLNVYQGVLNDLSETALDEYKGFDVVLTEEFNRVPKDLEALAAQIMERLVAHEA